MKRWKNFLADLGTKDQVFVVGPLLQAHTYVPTGPTIYVDGGTQFRPIGGGERFPSVIVGDGDSGATDLDVALPRKKDFSDLAFVFHSLPATVRHVELLGFLGGRRDHELINYGEANLFLRSKKEFTTVRFDQSIIAFAGGSLKFEASGTFSVAVFEKAAIKITGAVKYPLSRSTRIRPASSLGLSNEGRGTVVIECNKPCFLFIN